MTAHTHRVHIPGCFRCELSVDEVEVSPERVDTAANGDLHVTDSLGRTARLHWSRFHGVIVLMDRPGAVYLGQDEVTEWLQRHLAS